MFAVNVNEEGIVKATDKDGATITIDDGRGFGVSRDEDSAATFGAGNGSVGLDELSHGTLEVELSLKL